MIARAVIPNIIVDFQLFLSLPLAALHLVDVRVLLQILHQFILELLDFVTLVSVDSFHDIAEHELLLIKIELVGS